MGKSAADTIKIKASKVDDYRAIKQLLTQRNLEHHTFQLDEEKTQHKTRHKRYPYMSPLSRNSRRIKGKRTQNINHIKVTYVTTPQRNRNSDGPITKQ